MLLRDRSTLRRAPQGAEGNMRAFREMLATGSAVEGALILAKGLVLKRGRRAGDRSALDLRSSHLIDELALQYGRAMGGYLAAVQVDFRLANGRKPHGRDRGRAVS